MLAAAKGRLAVVTKLAQLGADPFATNIVRSDRFRCRNAFL